MECVKSNFGFVIFMEFAKATFWLIELPPALAGGNSIPF